MTGSYIIKIPLFLILFAAVPAFGLEPCETELSNFISTRSDQISAEHDFSSLQRRLNSELFAVARISASYDRRAARLRYLRAKALADAAVASALCGFFNPAACRRLSSLSRRISSLQVQLSTLSFQKSTSLRCRRARISRLRSEVETARAALQQADLLYVRALSALNNCEADI